MKILRLRSIPRWSKSSHSNRVRPPFYLQDTFSTAVKPLPANRPSRSLPPLSLSNSTTQSAPFWHWDCSLGVQVWTKHTISSGLIRRLAFSLYRRLESSRLWICGNYSSLSVWPPDFWSSLLPRTLSSHFSSSAYFLTRRYASLDLRGWHEAKGRNSDIQREPRLTINPVHGPGIGHLRIRQSLNGSSSPASVL